MTNNPFKDPNGKSYEDQICSMLLARGYYLETRLILRKYSQEVLEFDAIATPVNDWGARTIVEVKSGEWGISDMFKLYGQTTFTGESTAWLIHKNPQHDESRKQIIADISKRICVQTFQVTSYDDVDSIPLGLDIPKKISECVYAASWLSRTAERIAQSRFNNWRKSHSKIPEPIESARQYLEEVNSSVFRKGPFSRTMALYNAYQNHPRVTRSLIEHTADRKGWREDCVKRKVFGKGGLAHIQYVGAQEHRARAAIIKNAYDAIREDDNDCDVSTDQRIERIFRQLLPNSFVAGMRRMESLQYAEKLPRFLQLFVEVFGGFLCPDDPEELSLISLATGVQKKDIKDALDVYNHFFPINGNWIHRGDNVLFLKTVPSYLKAAGCFLRYCVYGDNWQGRFPQLRNQIPMWCKSLSDLFGKTE